MEGGMEGGEKGRGAGGERRRNKMMTVYPSRGRPADTSDMMAQQRHCGRKWGVGEEGDMMSSMRLILESTLPMTV